MDQRIAVTKFGRSSAERAEESKRTSAIFVWGQI